MNRINRWTPLAVTVGLVVWLESIFTIEWTNPYCLDQSDGPTYGAYGMPLPYWIWNGVASLEHDFVPHAYVLNIVLLCMLFFPVARWAVNRSVFQRRPWVAGAAAIIGLLLLAYHVTLTVGMVSLGWYRPTSTLGSPGYYSYTELRPVRFGFYRSNAPPCAKSPYWYPNGWKHD
jgi:hypothetical protein